MKEKLTPDPPGYHVSNKNCAIEVVGFNKNSTSIVLACCLCSDHLSIIEILIYLCSIQSRKTCPNLRKLYDLDLLTVPWREKEGNLE